jgi:hypothetical protein
MWKQNFWVCSHVVDIILWWFPFVNSAKNRYEISIIDYPQHMSTVPTVKLIIYMKWGTADDRRDV